jgi:hypothetical protein
MPVEQLVFHCDFELRPIIGWSRTDAGGPTSASADRSAEPIGVSVRDADSYGQFLSKRFPSVPSRRAFFVESDTRLAVYAHWSDRVGEDLRHEVAHGYLHSMVQGLPLWLDEGLAEYFEVPRGNNGQPEYRQ